MRVWKFKKNLLLLIFICHNIIYFLHNSAFQVATAMCTAGRPATFYYAPFWGMVCGPNIRAYSYLPAVDIHNFIHKAAAAMWTLATIFI